MSSIDQATGFSFEVGKHLDGGLGRTGLIHTPHGDIATPAFTPVGTKATIKSVLPESMTELGAQALLANAYHLFLQPGSDIIDEAGGLGVFMNWPGPTYTDSGGFQVMSLGSGHKKVISMSLADQGLPKEVYSSSGKSGKLVQVDDEGVTFTSHINGTRHRFTPEVSMRIQHQLGADIMFAFDELTTLSDPRSYQEMSLGRTTAWAQRCLDEHVRLTAERSHRTYQALFGVIQGAHYEDLRRKAVRDLLALRARGEHAGSEQGFDGYGIGGALEKENLGTIVGWVCSELPDEAPRHLLGISEPDDFFTAIENGADTFDCVSPARVARNAALYTKDGRFNVNTAGQRRNFTPVEDDCDCYTCANYTRAYLHHLFKAHEMLANTLATIHNERFIVRLVDDIRFSIVAGEFEALKTEFLGRYYAGKR